MQILADYRRDRAIRGYRRRLPTLLRRDHGSQFGCTPAQIRTSLERGGLDPFFLSYALAMFVDKPIFDAFHKAQRESCDYDVLRAHVSHVCLGGAALTLDALSG